MSGLRVLLYANVDRTHAGGVQSVVRALRSHLEARGHRVATGWAESDGAGHGGRDGWAEQFPVRPGKGRWLHLPTAARLARRLLRERPQVVNVHYASPSVRYFNALAPWLGFRVVVTCHGSDVLRPLEQDADHLPQVTKTADRVTAVSPEIAARLADRGLLPAGGLEVIPNGVDTGFWCPPQTRPQDRTEPVLVTVGRLEPVKGIDLLIAACGALAARGRPVRLVIVGEGSERAALERQAADWGIAERVIFAGRLAPGAVRDRLHAADLFVLPSRSEGMPLALMEAMATGIACMAADVGGVAQTAAGAARLVAPDDPESLAAAIAELSDDPEARAALGELALLRAGDFSVARTYAAYEALMLGLAAPARS